jgi:hypothetical protein
MAGGADDISVNTRWPVGLTLCQYVYQMAGGADAVSVNTRWLVELTLYRHQCLDAPRYQ